MLTDSKVTLTSALNRKSGEEEETLGATNRISRSVTSRENITPPTTRPKKNAFKIITLLKSLHLVELKFCYIFPEGKRIY